MKKLLLKCTFKLSPDHIDEHTIDLTEDEYYRLSNTDDLIQNIFPDKDDVFREKLISGTCEACQKILFAPPEDEFIETDDRDLSNNDLYGGTIG